MGLKSDPIDFWSVLKDSDYESPVRRVFAGDGRSLWIGLKSRQPEVRIFFMLIGRINATDFTDIPDVKGFKLRIFDDDSIRTDRSRIELELNNISDSQIFDSLIDDIAVSVNKSDTEESAIFNFIETIFGWQSFLEKTGNKKLSKEQQRGLFGELITLKTLMIPQAGIHSAIQSWQGDQSIRGLRDFEYNGVGVEVKTTTTKNPETFTVSSEDQLDSRNLKGIVVHHLSLDQTLTEGESLQSLILEILSEIESNRSKTLFFQRLYNLGYSTEQGELYLSPKYQIRNQYIFSVSENFPRITEESLMQGISNVRYRVSIDYCLDYQITKEKFWELIKVD